MAIDVQEFHHELFQDVHAQADADGIYAEDAFFDVFTTMVMDAGDLDAADRAHYVSPRGLRVDGYGGDPLETDGVLSLIVADFNQDSTVATLTATDMDASFRRVSTFLERSLDDRFRNGLEESSPAFGLADLISTRWKAVSKLRLLLISNRMLSSRVDGREAGEINGRPVTYSVWDLGRFHRYALSGREREEIVVDMEQFGGPLVLLPAHVESAQYEAYLTVFPGNQLARIYDRWSSRLLEQNVRVFLQARGNVNRGIRGTIENNPEMFFAYNNGITATAESVETEAQGGTLLLTKMHNFQIVNGGQTTASIHAAMRNREVELDRIFVQMKLSIVDPDRALEIVPKISEYANSQNRVSAADFFSNHPFHVRLEEFSRRMYVPAKDGSFRESKWFYERARGQYQDARGRLPQSGRRQHDLEYPKNQVFSKTDVAKFLNVWRDQPHVVSRGAQKNFAEFAKTIGPDWEKNAARFNERFYKEVVAKAIVFRSVERLVSKQPWYQGGYRANIVAYAIAKLSHDIENRGRSLDFERIWAAQEISGNLQDALTASAKAVHDVIIEPPAGMRNVTEWAKQQACWARVRDLNVNWPSGLEGELMSPADREEAERIAVKDQKEWDTIQDEILVAQMGAEFWLSLRDWGVSKGHLSQNDERILEVAASAIEKMPTTRQCRQAVELLARLRDEGCPLEKDAA